METVALPKRLALRMWRWLVSTLKQALPSIPRTVLLIKVALLSFLPFIGIICLLVWALGLPKPEDLPRIDYGTLFLMWLITYFPTFAFIYNRYPEPGLTARELAALHEARMQQLEALKAAVPKDLPASMRATVQTNTFKAQDGQYKFAVDMILELTETERAIIKEYELDDIVLESVALFSEDKLKDQKRNIERAKWDVENKAYGPFSGGAMLNDRIRVNSEELALAQMKESRRVTRIGPMLVAPYSQFFDSPHEASQYAHNLKTKLLPKMKEILTAHFGHKPSETLTF